MSADAPIRVPLDSERIDAQNTDHALVVLVVEDEVLIRFALADYLRDCGLKVHEAGSGREAIQILHETDIDVVFTDVYMPGSVDGFDLTQWMDENRPDVPVILASGAVDGALARAHARGSFFPKPYDPNLVVLAIQAAANARARTRRA